MSAEDVEEPKGVRVVHADGTETRCELTYLGVNDNNRCHEWDIGQYVAFENGDHLEVDVMPGHTGLVLGANLEAEKQYQFGVEWRDQPEPSAKWYHQILRVKKR